MPLSSPFHSAHRRTRSHSSLDTPSSSPVHHRQEHPSSPTVLSNNVPPLYVSDPSSAHASFAPVSSDRSVQPPGKWSVDRWRRGKRPRHGQGPFSPCEDADMESCDEHVPGPPMSSGVTKYPSTASSAPSTPHLPSTSEAFQFFPSRAPASSMPFGSPPDISHDEDLAQMHSDAFSDLRKTVVEAGEGFVRRMREFEANRSGADASHFRGVTSAAQTSNTSALKETQKRGRKRPSPTTSRRQAALHPGSSHKLEQYHIDEDDSDIEILSSRASSSDDYPDWSPSKKRAVSLGAINNCFIPQSQSHPFPLPLGQRDRSSSPSAYSLSSDEDDDIVFGNTGTSQHRHRRHRSRLSHTSSTHSTTPPLSFSFTSMSRSSSIASLQRTAPDQHRVIPSSPSLSASMHERFPSLMTSRNSKRSEKAVAALSLALANGAGSVSDYEALRVAQGIVALDASEAGDLWD